MAKKFNELLDHIDSSEQRFYDAVLPLHEDERLRAYAKRNYGFKITGGGSSSSTALYFSENGFRATIPKFVGGDDMYSGSYHGKCYPFKLEEGKLVVASHKGKEEMLDLFPDLTVDKIESALEQEIKKTKIFKKFQEG